MGFRNVPSKLPGNKRALWRAQGRLFRYDFEAVAQWNGRKDHCIWLIILIRLEPTAIRIQPAIADKIMGGIMMPATAFPVGRL